MLFHAYVHFGGSSDSRIEELERTVAELQSKLKDVTAELKAEKEKVEIWISILHPFRKQCWCKLKIDFFS